MSSDTYPEMLSGRHMNCFFYFLQCSLPQQNYCKIPKADAEKEVDRVPYSCIEVCSKSDQATYLTGEGFEGLLAIESGEYSRQKYIF